MTPIIHEHALWFTLGMIAGAAFVVFGYWLTGKK
jgi:hypothetical protein